MIEAGKREESQDLRARAYDRQLPVCLPGPCDAAHERAESRGVHEINALQIHDDTVMTLLDQRADALLELRRRIEVNLSTDREYHPRIDRAGFEFQIDRSHLHGGTPADLGGGSV